MRGRCARPDRSCRTEQPHWAVLHDDKDYEFIAEITGQPLGAIGTVMVAEVHTFHRLHRSMSPPS